MINKSILRKEFLAKRNSLTLNERTIKSEIICQKVSSHPKFLEAEIILIYMPIESEVSTLSLIKQSWNLSKKVGLPKIQNNEMEFYAVKDFTELTKGPFNILEPSSEHLIKTSNALMIMPGVIFDLHKNRIGYGKGFYDRYLILHPEIETIALAFDCQIIESIQTEPHDIAPHFLITESLIIE